VTLNENRTNIVTQALPAIGSSRFLAVWKSKGYLVSYISHDFA
jgi:hypothetical protein